MKAQFKGTQTSTGRTIRGLTVQEYKRQWYQENKAKKAVVTTLSSRESYQAALTKKRQRRMLAGLHTRTGKPLNSILGSIYIAQVEGQTASKIGYSTEGLGKKQSKIQMYHAHQVNMVLYSDEVQGVNFLEVKLHDMFKDKRIRGEWFNLTKTDIKKIKSLIKNNRTVTGRTVL